MPAPITIYSLPPFGLGSPGSDVEAEVETDAAPGDEARRWLDYGVWHPMALRRLTSDEEVDALLATIPTVDLRRASD